MATVSRPVRFTALATAAGFAVLLFMNIVPVQVFGGLIAFGTVVLRLLSFSFIPAVLTFVKEDKLRKAAGGEDVKADPLARTLGRIASLGANKPAATLAVMLALAAVSVWGTSTIHINNNLVAWFKPGSEIRIADSAMNQALGGTALGYLVGSGTEEEFIKRPEAMRWLEGLQHHLEKLPVVGKTFSVADYVKRINLVLHDNDPKFDVIPDTKDTVGQYLFLFSMSAKPADLNNVVDPAFRQANLWVQMKTWDADAMRQVIAAKDLYQKANPLPVKAEPAGIAWFNLVERRGAGRPGAGLQPGPGCRAAHPGPGLPLAEVGADRLCSAAADDPDDLWRGRLRRQGFRYAAVGDEHAVPGHGGGFRDSLRQPLPPATRRSWC